MFTNKCRNECYKSYLGITQILRNKYKKAVDPSHVNELPIFQYASSEPKTHKRIYTWGVAAHGAQGDGEFVRPKNRSIQPKLAVKRPHRLEFGEFHDVKDVSCGYGFSVFAVKSKDNNKVFGCGLNTTSQIGYQSARKGAPLEILLEPVPISIPYINPSETRVRSVACGRAHTVVATDEGVFTLGHNGYGQCGRRIIPNEEYFGSKIVHKVPELQDLDVTDVVCGQDHSIFLCKTGKVLACGWSADGQTGVSHYDNQEEPAEVMGDIQGEKIVKVATSADCVLAINGNGDLFGWGNNEYGQLNSATEDMQLNVSRILKLPPYVGKIIDIAVGGTVCIILNDRGSVFTWGYGLLGKGPKLDQSTNPEEIPPTLFGKSELNSNRKVRKIFAGINNFYAVNDNGDAYAWGRNKDFSLGLNHNKNQYFPLKVALPCRVQKLSVGVDHTIAICTSYT